MLYINNELVAKKDEKLFSTFKTEFAAHMDGFKIRANNPIVLKYKPEMIKPDPDNKGKLLMPVSVHLKLVSFVNINGNMAEVRYSTTAPRVDKDTKTAVFPVNTLTVERGRLTIYDIDLAFYVWAYSTQNYEKYPANTDAYFIIENAEGERAALARAKRNEATASARIWNEPADGGLSDSRLRLVGKDMMIPGAGDMDITQLRQTLDNMMKMDKGTSVNRDLFLSLSDPHKSVEEAKMNENYVERKAIVTEAIINELISHNTSKMQFFLNDTEGVPLKNDEGIAVPLFDYASYKKAGDKTNRQELLYLHLEENNPDLLDELKAKLDKISKLATQTA